MLTFDFINELENFLLNYLFNFSNLEKYVQEQIIRVIVIIYKRFKLDSISKNQINESNQFPNLIKNIVELFKSDNTQLVNNLIKI